MTHLMIITLIMVNLLYLKDVAIALKSVLGQRTSASLTVVFVNELICFTFLNPVERVLLVVPFQVDLNLNFCSLDDSSTVLAVFHGKEGFA